MRYILALLLLVGLAPAADQKPLVINPTTGKTEQMQAGNTLLIPGATGTTLTVSSTTDSTSKDTGSIVTEGGLGVEKALNVGTTLMVNGATTLSAAAGTSLISSSVTDATSPIAAGSTFAGGVAVAKKLWTGGNVTIGDGTATVLGYTNGPASGTAGGSWFGAQNAGSTVIAIGNKSALVGGAYDATPYIYGSAAIFSNVAFAIPSLTLTSTTDSTSKDTGSIVTEGGLGVEKAVVAGGTITGGAGVYSTGGTNPAATTTAVYSRVTGSDPYLNFIRSANAADNRIWDTYVTAFGLEFRAVNDAYSSASNWLTVERSGTTISSILFGGPTFCSSNLTLLTAGSGLLIKEGANAKMGSVALVGGTITVNTTAVTANSRIYLTSQVDGGTPGYLRVSGRTAATSFTITSGSGTDTSTVAWLIVEPAP